jgi:TPR repeat protein
MAAAMLGFWASAAPAETSRDPPTAPETIAALRQMQEGHIDLGRAALERLALAGQADAIEALGEILQAGVEGLPADRPAACRYFAMAEGKRGDATHNLALCYEQGVFGNPDLPRAAQLYQRAADLGFQKSKCALGNLYLFGKGVARDTTLGLKLCTEAAEAGIADAQADVGNIYLSGNGVVRDYAQARRWYQMAAAQRQHQAARTLGEMYARGDGGPQSWSEAKRLWQIAADAGDRYAPGLLALRMTAELLAADFRLGDPIRAAEIDEAIKWSELSIARNPDPKEIEAAKGGLGILRGLKEADQKLTHH